MGAVMYTPSERTRSSQNRSGTWNRGVTDAVVNGLAANIDELGELARLTTGGRTGL